MNATDVYLARERLRGVMASTPLVRHPLLDQALGAETWIKLENTTPTGVPLMSVE